MTDKPTHTPLPWIAERDLPHNRMPRVHSSADGSLICECGNMGTTQDQWEANAAFIVHAVNSHHDLIEALRALELANDRVCGARPQRVYDAMIAAGMSDALLALDEARRSARAILTKAEAGHG